MRKFGKFAATAALVLAGLYGCAGDVTLIDRTQPNRVDKSIFTGEWYFRPSVIEVDFNQGILFEGLEGDMDRVKWKIEQDQLIAYRSYEILYDAEGEAHTGTGTPGFQGPPVAAFAIASHFDVIRDYNAATGEQTPVLVENTTDRPWYERQYMRVDWSQNLLNNTWSIEGAVQALSGAPYYVQEHEIDNPHRAEVTATNINIVGNYLLMNDFSTCYYMFLDPYFCGTSEAKMKLSFMKVVERDYEVLSYPDVALLSDSNGSPIYTSCYNDGTCRKLYLTVFERFGLFRHEHRVYNEVYRWTRDGRVFLGHRWNLWKRTRDNAGNLIPLDRRVPSTVTYYTNVEFPTDNDVWMASAATNTDVASGRATRIGIVPDWDRAFGATMEGLGNTRYRPVSLGGEPLFQLKRNSCNLANVKAFAKSYQDALSEHGIGSIEPGNLKRACAVLEAVSADSSNPFVWQKQGDLRYSYLHWVDKPQVAGPLGYGPSSADPITGELISATANIYGASVDELAAYAADVVELANCQPGDCELSVDELLRGENIREHIESSRMRANRNLDQAKMAAFNQGMQANSGTAIPQQVKFRPDAARNGRIDIDYNSVLALKERYHVPADRGSSKLANLKGTWVEKELLTSDEIRRAMLGPERYQPGQPIYGDDADASPLAWLSEDVTQKQRAATLKLMKSCILMTSWTDPGMLSLVRDLQGWTWEEVYAYMRREIYRSVMAHEVGHTLGLRHNFMGSIDALNYQPQFWLGADSQPNTADDYYRAATQADVDAGRASAVGQYFVDKDAGADKHMYSSIMDYDARFYADSLHGIGLYDTAAIKFAYGNLVETFAPDVAAYSYDSLMFLHDYTAIPQILGDTVCKWGNCNNPDASTAAMGTGSYLDQYYTAVDAAQAAEEAGNAAAAAQAWNDADVAIELYSRHFNNYWRDGLQGVAPTVGNIYRRVDVSFDDLVSAWTSAYVCSSYQDEQSCAGAGYCSWINNTTDGTFCYNSGGSCAKHNDSAACGGDANCFWYQLSPNNFDCLLGSIPDEVPYGYCPDEYVGYTWPDCQAYDKGANYLEVTRDRMERYDAYYFFTNFKRDRASFNDWSYIDSYLGRLYDRYFGQMSNVYIYYLYGFSNMGYDTSGNRLTLIDFPVGRTWQAAGLDGLNFLASILEQPEPGSYCLDQATDANGVYRPAADLSGCPASTVVSLPSGYDVPSGIEVPAGVGKYYYTNWTNEYYYKATRIGTFWDKYLAMYAITDNQGFFYRDFSSYFDVGSFALSYWSSGLRTQMLDLLASQFDGGTGKFAWRYAPGAGAAQRFQPAPVVDIYEVVNDPILLNADPSAADPRPRIEASTSWTLRYYGVVWPMIRFNHPFDYSTDFSNYARTCLNGYLDCMTFDAAVGQEEYTDPLTGYVYVASLTDKPQHAIGAKILRDAQAYADSEYVPARECYDDAAAGTFTRCANGTTLLEAEAALLEKERGINQHTSFIDIVRQIGYLTQ